MQKKTSYKKGQKGVDKEENSQNEQQRKKTGKKTVKNVVKTVQKNCQKLPKLKMKKNNTKKAKKLYAFDAISRAAGGFSRRRIISLIS